MRRGQMNPGMSCEPCPTQECAINHLETNVGFGLCLHVLGALTSLGDTARPLSPWGSCVIALILATLKWHQVAKELSMLALVLHWWDSGDGSPGVSHTRPRESPGAAVTARQAHKPGL